MRVHVVYSNENGNIEFTKEELEELLEQVYEEGKDDAIKMFNTKEIRINSTPEHFYKYSTTPRNSPYYDYINCKSYTGAADDPVYYDAFLKSLSSNRDICKDEIKNDIK